MKATDARTSPTEAYKPIVDEKTQIVTKDVNKAWKELYDRQAPLLTWPETVQERFRKWGRKWPENEDRGKVRLAIVDYIDAYPDYVDMVYKTFNPFDYETGKGIVAAPPKDAAAPAGPVLRREHAQPGQGLVGSGAALDPATVLEVIPQVNKNAKNWDSAIVKQIEVLEVGSQVAQDQRSIANERAAHQGRGHPRPGPGGCRLKTRVAAVPGWAWRAALAVASMMSP